MANTVVSRIIYESPTKVVYHMAFIRDTADETAVTKVDRSASVCSGGATTSYLSLKSVRWAVQGFTSVRLLGDNAGTDDLIMALSGNGYDEFDNPLTYPNTEAIATVVGDVLLTSIGGSANATYDITAVFTKS